LENTGKGKKLMPRIEKTVSAIVGQSVRKKESRCFICANVDKVIEEYVSKKREVFSGRTFLNKKYPD
jgi:hypothetical protein